MVWVITALIWSGGYPVYKGVNIWEQKTAEPQLTSNIPWNRQYQVADGPFPLGARLAANGRSATHFDDVENFYELLNETRSGTGKSDRETCI